MRDLDDGVDSAADVEVALDGHPTRREERDEVVEDPVRHRLVEVTLVAERPQVELQALELDAALVGSVADPDRREVGLPRLRAETGELGRLESDLVVALGARV